MINEQNKSGTGANQGQQFIYLHYEKLANAIYTEFFSSKLKIALENFDIFNIFAQNKDRKYTLEPPRRGGEAVLTSTHNLCFGAKNKKEIGIALHTPVLLNKRVV